MPVATPIAVDDDDLAQVRFNADGLVPAIVQEQGTGAVLMLAWMNDEALHRTLTTGRTWFWSRSRKEYWCKGETSGDRQWVRQAYYDCDGDTLLVVVEQEGKGACHTGNYSCFFRAFGTGGSGGSDGLGGTVGSGDGSGGSGSTGVDTPCVSSVDSSPPAL